MESNVTTMQLTTRMPTRSLGAARLIPAGRSDWLPALLTETTILRALAPSQRFGRYELVERLGRGGMGDVWRARHRLLGSEAAIKVIRPELLGALSADDAQVLFERFEREARATASLTSPHTIRLFDFGATSDRVFYYVMELLEGRDLDALVRASGPVPFAKALRFVYQICSSLAEAHAKGLVHRDVTPSNVYACRMGIEHDFIKVLDFGLVTPVEGPPIDGHLRRSPEKAAGTPAFMAPELIRCDAVSPSVDVYAVGCLMYFLITGQPVFIGRSVTELFDRHLWSQPIPPSTRAPSIPHELDRFVEVCLDKDRSRRPADASQLLDVLRPLCDRWTWTADDAAGDVHPHAAAGNR